MDNPDHLTWRTSSYSGSNGGNCIEIAVTAASGTVAVRDSKDPAGAMLEFGPQDWMRFADQVKRAR
jgi:hypothetical protein